MTLWVIDPPGLQKTMWLLALSDLQKICRDPNLGFEPIPEEAMKLGRISSGRVTYLRGGYGEPTAPTLSSVGCDLVGKIINLTGRHALIFPAPTKYPVATTSDGETITLEELAGLTIGMRRQSSAVNDLVNIYYDPEGRHCVKDAKGKEIAFPSHVILYHELAHAYRILTNTEDPSTDDRGAIADENLFRDSIQRPHRAGHEGRLCPAANQCFIATAAHGSELAPDVEFLRRFRDDVLRKTPGGRAFFDEYWTHYARVSPAIVQAMEADEHVRELVKWSIVTPIVRYLRLIMEFPDASPADLAEPWRSFLTALGRDIEEWTARIPLPDRLSSLSPDDAAEELRVTLRYVLRRPETRRDYLERLTALGELPLVTTPGERHRIKGVLAAAGRSGEEIAAILGDEPKSDPEVRFGYGPNHVMTKSDLAPASWPYTVRIRNGTVQTFDEVVLFYERTDRSGVIFMAEPSVAPGDTRLFPLGLCRVLKRYVVGCFIGGQMVARLPEAGGAMTPALAATLDPFREDECSDGWVIQAQALLPLSQYSYQVSIKNGTRDTWDEIVLIYKSKGQALDDRSATAVPPGSTRKFDLGPCDKLESYTIGISIRGVIEPVGFPADGVMTPQRAFEMKPWDTDSCGDVWEFYE